MKHVISAILLIFILSGCKKSGSDNTTPPPPPAPKAATLSQPAQNAACVTTQIISASQSTVTFSWNVGAHANSYDLVISNLIDNSILDRPTKLNNLNVTLPRGTPYSWYVVSRSTTSADTALSPTWKFYNPGPGATTYLPFPAELTAPAFGQQVSASADVILTWAGSSVNNETLTYDIYLGTTSQPALYQSNVSTMYLSNIPVQSGTLYYWQVVSKDSFGNSVPSQVSEFSAQ